MIELSGLELLVPAIVSAVVVAVRQFSAKLDGPPAYWWAIGLNVAGQVLVAFVADGGSITTAGIFYAGALGIGTGATVSVGVATAGKRLGAGRMVKPRRDSL